MIVCCADDKDENFNVIYINDKFKPEEWHTFEVGTTHFNDDALRRTGAWHLSIRLTFRRGCD